MRVRIPSITHLFPAKRRDFPGEQDRLGVAFVPGSMVTYIIKVTEVRGRGVMVDVKPNEADATAKEKETAGIIDHLMQPIFDLLASSGGQPKTLDSRDLEATRSLIEKKARRFLA